MTTIGRKFGKRLTFEGCGHPRLSSEDRRMAARRILRELGLVAVSPRWGIPERMLGVEWEHRNE